MDAEELRWIITLILEALEEARRPKKALVLFTGALIGFEESLESLKELQRLGLQMTAVTTTSADYVLDRAKIDALGMAQPGPSMISSHDLLIIPTCTVNTVAKVARGIADTLSTNLISEFISYGKKVVACTSACCPDSPAKRQGFPLLPEAQAALWRDNLTRMQNLGVILSPVEKLTATVTKALSLPDPGTTPVATPQSQQVTVNDRLISAHHIQSLPTGSVLAIRRDAMVTHFATDVARSRSIRIERV